MSKKYRQGFSLVEFMVAIFLTSIMMTGAVFIYIYFTELLDRNIGAFEVQQQGTYALTLMTADIKQGNDYLIENYGSGVSNKITIYHIPTPSGGIKTVEFFWDNDATQYYRPIKRKESEEITIIPETYVDDGEIKSRLEVTRLRFTEETIPGISGKSVGIDLTIQSSDNQPWDFTTSVRLRNENVH